MGTPRAGFFPPSPCRPPARGAGLCTAGGFHEQQPRHEALSRSWSPRGSPVTLLWADPSPTSMVSTDAAQHPIPGDGPAPPPARGTWKLRRTPNHGDRH